MIFEDQGFAFSSRRTVLRAGAAVMLMASGVASASPQIVAVRMWPSKEYSRVTLESDEILEAKYFLVSSPDRFVVDVQGLDLTQELRELVTKVRPDDPYISAVRIGQNRPGVVRMVFDLKADVRPQVFMLKPFAGYRHRLVFDLFPVQKAEATAGEDDSLASEVQAEKKGEERLPALAGEKTTAAESEPSQTETPARPKKTKRLVIALDPGHGGEDPGAVGKSGAKEKDVVLAIARRLKRRLEQDINAKVLLTRDGDYFVPLRVRVKKARVAKADLFISIHADAWVDRSANGSSVFVLSEKGATSASARWLAANQNEADLIGGVNLAVHDKSLASVLLDMSTTAQIKDSLDLGGCVLRELSKINRLHKSTVEQAGFAVLKAPDIPSILVETAFISNPGEEVHLMSEDYQEKISQAISAGMQKYLTSLKKL